MYLFKRNPDPRQKPPVGSRLNPDHPLSKGLVGCWLMNEGGGSEIYDVAHNNAGTFNGALSWNGDAIKGSTLQYIDCGDRPEYYNQRFTFITKFLSYNAIDGSVFAQIVWNADRQFQFNWDHATSSAFQQAVAICSAGSWHSAKLTTSLSPNVDYVVAGKYDGQLKAYLNGSLEATTACGSPDSISGVLSLLNRAGSYMNFAGEMWFFMLYSRALTDSEILQLYEEPYGHILAPQYWYMVDFGAAGTTITLIKMSQDWQGKDVKANMSITTPAFSMSWTGKSAKANIAITLVKMTQSWVGKALYANKLITLAKTAIAWTGKNVLLEKVIHPAKMALSWVGKTITINGGALGRRFLGLYRRIIGDLIR